MHMIIQLDSNHQIWEQTECYSLLSFVYAQMNLEREEGLNLRAESPVTQNFPLLTFHQATLVVGIYL